MNVGDDNNSDDDDASLEPTSRSKRVIIEVNENGLRDKRDEHRDGNENRNGECGNKGVSTRGVWGSENGEEAWQEEGDRVLFIFTKKFGIEKLSNRFDN